MISSEVTPVGGVFSSGPSCATAGTAASALARTKRAAKSRTPRKASFIAIVYWIWVFRRDDASTAAALPDPSPLSGTGAGASVLPCSWMPDGPKGLPPGAAWTDSSAGVPPAVPSATCARRGGATKPATLSRLLRRQQHAAFLSWSSCHHFFHFPDRRAGQAPLHFRRHDEAQ